MPAVAFNAVMTANKTNAGNDCELLGVTNLTSSSPTCSIIVAAGSNITFIFAITFQNNVSAISGTIGSTPLVLVGGPITGTNCGFTYIYQAQGITAGTYAVAMSWTTSSDVWACGVAFSNAAGGAAGFTSGTGSSTNPSITQTVTGGANDAVMSMCQNIHTNIPANSNGTNISNNGNTTINAGASYFITPSSSQAVSYTMTSDNWVICSVDLLNVAPVTVVPIWLLTA